jgi:Skp family chaperone for outer membrane proteins
MKKSKLSVLIIASVVLLTGFAGVQAGSLLAPQPTKIAIVDVIKVRNGLKEAKSISVEIEEKLRKAEQEQKSRVEEIKQIQEDLSILVPGTTDYKDKQLELITKSVEAKAWQEVAKAQLNVEHAVQLEAMYRKIVAASTDIATVHGYDMVLSKERDINFRNAKPKEIDALIALRKILWSRDDMDITDLVIQKMNNDFANAM